jgi:hypothetical protein
MCNKPEENDIAGGGGPQETSTTIYFNILEIVPFFRLFTREGNIEYTGCGNTEHRGLKAIEYFPDCHLAKIVLRKHVMHCDGS